MKCDIEQELAFTPNSSQQKLDEFRRLRNVQMPTRLHLHLQYLTDTLIQSDLYLVHFCLRQWPTSSLPELETSNQ